MKITILAVGQKMPVWVNSAFDEYAKRFGREITLELKEIKPEKRSHSVTAEKAIQAEQTRLMTALPAKAYLIVLDEKGKILTSQMLAQSMRQWLTDGVDIAFIIGGADGLSNKLKQQANMLMQLSALTLPHGLARVLLVEQLYRAASILNNHPYHRE